jgi:hypothetical protein
VDQVLNPYSPGPGARPFEVVGRAAEISEMDVALQRIRTGRSAQSQLVTGLRGVGKTVLLHEFGRVAATRGFVHEHIEASPDGALPLRLALALRKAVLKLGGRKKTKGADRRALGVLKAFTLTLPDGVTVHIEADAATGTADSGDLASDLATLFEEVGQAAGAHDSGIFLTIDEMHHVPSASLGALLVALQRAHQLGLPITMAGAGLPMLAGVTGLATSCAEQTLRLRPLGPLGPDDCAAAVVAPATAEGVSWKGAAVARLFEVSQGYPSFIQELGRQAWDLAEAGSKVIRLGDVERAVPLAHAELDEGFFQVRAARTTVPERAYLRAMAELGPGIVSSGDVASLLQKRTTQVAPVRDTLIKKALCFSPRFNGLAFTAPMFDQFMKRWMPSLG